jgi:ribonuclease P protein component
VKNSLQKKRIQTVTKSGRKFRTPYFLIKICVGESPQAVSRVAFSFSRKAGNAVMRNRFKRRIRDLIRRQSVAASVGDFLFIALKPLETLTETAWPAELARLREICERVNKPSRPVAPQNL